MSTSTTEGTVDLQIQKVNNIYEFLHDLQQIIITLSHKISDAPMTIKEKVKCMGKEMISNANPKPTSSSVISFMSDT